MANIDPHTFSSAKPVDEFLDISEAEEARLYDIAAANARMREMRDAWAEEYRHGERKVGRNIRDQRTTSGVSQEALANLLSGMGIEMHQSTIAKIEAGKRPIRVSEVYAIADALDVPWVYLLEGGRQPDMLPDDENAPIDVLEEQLESLLMKRQQVLEDISHQIVEQAKRYAEWDAKLILRSAAIARASAAAKLDAANGRMDTDRLDALAQKWIQEATTAGGARRRRKQAQDGSAANSAG